MVTNDNVRIPVIVSKRRINFVSPDFLPQIFTIYNPFEHSIEYTVLGTSTTNYEVGNPSGNIDPNCCKDITVRCKASLPIGNVDKLKIIISRTGMNNSDITGSRDIELVTMSKKFDQTKDSLPAISPTRYEREQRFAGQQEINHAPCFLIGLLCIIALFMPTSNDSSHFSPQSNIPEYFHLTIPQKLVAAYILGIVSLLILRPN